MERKFFLLSGGVFFSVASLALLIWTVQRIGNPDRHAVPVAEGMVMTGNGDLFVIGTGKYGNLYKGSVLPTR